MTQNDPLLCGQENVKGYVLIWVEGKDIAQDFHNRSNLIQRNLLCVKFYYSI